MNLKNDYFIGRLCDREIEKLDNLKIDQQITFFINMALDFDGIAYESNRKSLFKDISTKDSNLLFDLFKGHPLIDYNDKRIYFKYDFFKSYFIELYASKVLIKKETKDITNKTKNILAEYVKYSNSFTKNVCGRISYDDDLKYFLIEITTNFISEIKTGTNISINRQSISSVVSIILVLLENSTIPFNTENRTKALVDIFGESLDYITIINLFGENISNVIFDFRNREINHAFFDNYPLFWECKINEQTSFNHSSFENLEPRKGITPPRIHGNLFIDCDTSGIRKVLDKKNTEESNAEETLKNNIKDIFKLFRHGGAFKEQKKEYIEKWSHYETLKSLLKNKVIHPYKNPKKPTLDQYKVSDEYNNIISIIDQRGINYEFQKIINIFK